MIYAIVTSWNRPAEINRFFESLRMASGYKLIKILWMDDGSDDEVLKLTKSHIAESLFDITLFIGDQDVDRKAKIRYADLINQAYIWLADKGLLIPENVIMHLCDNTVHRNDLFIDIYKQFSDNPKRKSAYWIQERRAVDANGNVIEGKEGIPVAWGHWKTIPPINLRGGAIFNPKGYLDHSQVAFRADTVFPWSTNPAYKASGDGEFFQEWCERWDEGIQPLDYGDTRVRSWETLYR